MASYFFMKHHDKFLGSNPPYVEPTSVTELALADYSYENLRIASKDWTEPVVVRQMFAQSPALNWVQDGKNWNAMQSLKDFNVSVIQNATMGKDHDINCETFKGADSRMTLFSEAINQVFDYDPKSNQPAKTMVIPPASRTHREVDYDLDKALYDLIEKDLDYRVFGGDWSVRGIANSVITQLWIGSGAEDLSQGTGWH